MTSTTLIIGGQRSGKTSKAKEIALDNTETPIYLATSRRMGEDHIRRIERHQKDRGDQWKTIEEDTALSSHNLSGKTVVIDCITLWLTNLFHDFDENIDTVLEHAQDEIDNLLEQNGTFIFITNEIGEGQRPQNRSQRTFTDLLGWFNQYLASQADTVYEMTAGIPTKIKDT